tara:strand:- start:33 stop:527 length:495 start_codon:yes stop_codon:yes gene_type:complete
MAITTNQLNAGMGNEGSGAPTAHEIFTKINNAKDKPAKIAVLKQYDNQAMRMLLKAAFDPKIKFDLPAGDPPFIRNEAPAGTEHTSLASEAKKLFHFVVGGNNTINKLKKETMFIQMLEGLQEKDADVLMSIKNKNLNNLYKGLTANLVKETFGWNDDFVRINK